MKVILLFCQNQLTNFHKTYLMVNFTSLSKSHHFAFTLSGEAIAIGIQSKNRITITWLTFIVVYGRHVEIWTTALHSEHKSNSNPHIIFPQSYRKNPRFRNRTQIANSRKNTNKQYIGFKLEHRSNNFSNMVKLIS